MRIRTPWIFTLAAGIYDTITQQETWRAHCRGMAPLVPGARVLDLGIGPGVSGIEMARVSPGSIFVGVDLSGPMLLRAKRHAASAGVNVPLVRADALHLPFADASFDAATGHSFLYLLDDSDAVLREVHRVVRPGGRIAFLEPNGVGGLRRLRAIIQGFRRGGFRFGSSMFLWSIFSGLHGRYTSATLAAQFGRHGFHAPAAKVTLDGLGLIGTAER